MSTKKQTIDVNGREIALLETHQEDFVCITDIAKYKKPDFKLVEFNQFKVVSADNYLPPGKKKRISKPKADAK